MVTRSLQSEMFRTYKPFMEIVDHRILSAFIQDKVNAMITSKTLDFDNTKLLEILDFSYECHRFQKRLEGTPYINHPYRVLLRLLDEDIQSFETIAITLLHDILEDTHLNPVELLKKYGENVQKGVLTLSREIKFEGVKVPDDEYFSKLHSSPAIIKKIKIYDRIDNTYAQLSIPKKTSQELKNTIEKYTANTHILYSKISDFDTDLQRKLNEASEYVMKYIS